MKKLLSIIIVTYKSQSLINSCLDSISKNIDISYYQVEVIIVDNSSGEDAKEIELIVNNHEIAQSIDTKYIKNTANLGYGQGNNLGIKYSCGEIICIMNPDINLIMPIFKNVLNHFSENPRLSLLGGKQIGYKDISFYILPEKRLAIVNYPLTILINKLNIFLKKHMYLSGALLFINRKKFKSIGYFDENIFMYSEESDITTRFLKKHYDIIFDKKLKYRHLIEGREKWLENRAIISFNSLKYYCNKYNYDIKKILKTTVITQKFKIIVLTLFGSKEQLLPYKEHLRFYKNKYSEVTNIAYKNIINKWN